ncbi:hypothetical protein F8568_043355 [Actinomadura sp. LD22]|uniref:Uncharacterized protein n=1 Tax=Actinomadura physcomitrii TaxID=2650748 RepID=A0A6I4MSX0_9ACTN|nr:hypothetical protein [Actinomadura physcomitrii]
MRRPAPGTNAARRYAPLPVGRLAAGTTRRLPPWLVGEVTSGPLADRRTAPARSPAAADLCPHTGRSLWLIQPCPLDFVIAPVVLFGGTDRTCS